MTPYEQVRLLLIAIGLAIVVLGAFMAYVICLERRLSRDDVRIAELYVYLKNNLPDMITELAELHRELTRLDAHVDLPPTAGMESEHRRARLQEAKQSITETLEGRTICGTQ